MLPHIINGNGTISIMLEGTMKPIDTAHKNYEAIKEALKNQEWDLVPELVNIAQEVENAINASDIGENIVTIKDGEVLYNGKPIHNTLTDRIISMAKEGFDISHMVKFLENLMKNPSYRAVNELYDFLEAGAIPITENGTFLAYKKIRNDWKDIYTGTIDNSIGAVISMPRNQVNEDSNQTCSTGLHVCSYDYLPSFGSTNNDRVVICEINPSDVVSIPKDYNNTKMRCCEYKVIGEVEDYQAENTLSKQSVVETADVTTGKIDGIVDTVAEEAKAIGKQITEGLDNCTIDDAWIRAILNDKGLSNETMASFSRKTLRNDTTGIGKMIARLIKSGDLDKTILDEILENDTSDKDVCGRCGYDLDGMSECPSCGYYN